MIAIDKTCGHRILFARGITVPSSLRIGDIVSVSRPQRELIPACDNSISLPASLACISAQIALDALPEPDLSGWTLADADFLSTLVLHTAAKRALARADEASFSCSIDAARFLDASPILFVPLSGDSFWSGCTLTVSAPWFRLYAGRVASLSRPPRRCEARRSFSGASGLPAYRRALRL